jgi:hypothetical protein
MFNNKRRGFAPVGSGWGVREREEFWMVVVRGLMCYRRPNASVLLFTHLT